MKKLLTFLIALTLIIGISCTVFGVDKQPSILLDGKNITSQLSPVTIEGNIYVKMISLARYMDIKVDQVSGSVFKLVNAKTGIDVELNKDIKDIKIKGQTKAVSIYPVIQKDDLMVPLANFIEWFGGEKVYASGSTIVLKSYSPVVFKDANLEAEIRLKIPKPTGDILVSEVESINLLDLKGKNINDIEGLEHFKNLKSLDLTKNNIKDLTPLRPLKLTSLYLKDNPVEDFSPTLGFYLNLKDIDKDFEIKNVQFEDPKLDRAIREKLSKPQGDLTITELSRIASLDISNKEITGLQGIQYLTGLAQLSLANNKINNLEPLKNLLGLKQLVLSSNSIESVGPLSSLTNLETLSLFRNEIADITPLGSLVMLKELSIWDNNVADISVLGNLPNLEALVITDNKIEKIDALKELKNLKELYLKGNNISDFSPLNGKKFIKTDFSMTVSFKDKNLEKAVREVLKKPAGAIQINEVSGITSLNLKKKGITNLQGMESFTGVCTLDLSYNQIKDISPLKSLYKLTTLSLSYNNITDISPLKSLTELYSLSLANNRIIDISALAETMKVRNLTLSKNPVTDFYPVKKYYSSLLSKDFDPKFISVTIDGQPVVFDTTPINEDSTILVPVSIIFKNLGINYTLKDKTLFATYNNKIISLEVGSDVAMVDSQEIKMRKPLKIYKGRIYVPVYIITQSIGAETKWDGATRTVDILTKKN